ncbi:hypothetical protein ABEB36_011062 [Hypothenemus hampei]|uniref:Carboxylesterase type B domain-containing protein n=1 Tax=Hypothenemus hampei TaxID=57062 RepID=A0ABD1EE25_HYPHA
MGLSGLEVFFRFLCLIIPAALRELPIITIPGQGKIRGVELSKVRIQKITAYYGIPYAQPPIGNLRFAPPVTEPLPDWDDTMNNTDFKPSCIQDKADYKQSELPFYQLLSEDDFPTNVSEDCLYLNVFVPNTSPPPGGFATIVWIHPGNFTTGLLSIWNPHTLVYRQNVIIVTFAWRLSILGFFTTMDAGAPGNNGLKDQQAAMKWVKNNINQFQGNPDNICIMGYGTGATSAGIHMINVESKKLFNKAILMSGSLFQLSPIRFPQDIRPELDYLVEQFGCGGRETATILSCLRVPQAENLVKHTTNFNWRPNIDKGLSNVSLDFFPELPKIAFDNNENAKIPVLTGYTNMEQALEIEDFDNTTLYSPDTLKQLISDFVSGELPNTNDTDEYCPKYTSLVVELVSFFYAPSMPSYDANTFRDIATKFVVEKNYAAPTVLLASYLSRDQPTFVYRFDMKPSSQIANKNLPSWVKVPHLFDLLYVWGVPYWKTDQREWDLRDRDRADIIPH